jgi:hypothetical protein
MEHAKMIKISLALIAVITIMLALTAPALADEYAKAGDKPSWDKGKGDRWGRMGHEPKDVYMTIAVDGMTGNTVTFSVMNMAMKGKEDKAVLIMPSAPLTGTYNMTNDMGYISTASFMPATMTIDAMNKTSVPVAGASAVMGMHDMKVIAKDKDYKVFKFGEVSFLTPNGTATTYKLDKPVRVTYSEDRKMVVMDAYPTFTQRMSEAFSTGAKFPADAKPVPITSLMKEKSAARAETVGYEKPAYVEPPV